MNKKLMIMTAFVSSAVLLQAALTPTTTYDGSGPLTDAANWDNGLWSNSNPGLVATTDGGSQDFGSTAWVYSFQVRQTGGTITDTADAGIALRGGADNTTDNCTFEIDDASNTGFGTKNLDISGKLTLWNQYQANGSTGNIFSVLNGYADVAILAGTNPANSTINILNGKLDVGSVSNGNLTVNMLATGTGEFNLADQSGALLDPMVLNFETGSLASFTIASNGGASAQGYWEAKIAAGYVEIDGGVVTRLAAFIIQDAGALGTGTTLSLLPSSSNLTTTTTFTGGDVNSAGNWTNSKPTSTGNPGLINANGWWAGGTDYHVRMAGGSITPTGGGGNLSMSGGAASGTASILEIDDTGATPLVYNGAGQITMWNGVAGSTGNELWMLNGEITFGKLNTTGNSAAVARINILNGIFNIDALKTNAASCTVTMLDGGTGAFNLDDMTSTTTMDKMILNFETGSEASFTIGNIAGATAVGYWETKITAGKVQLDGVAVTGLAAFTIEDVGALGTKISLNSLLSTDNVFIAGSGSVLEIVYDGPPSRGNISSGNTNDWSGGLPTNGNTGLIVGGTYDFINPTHGGMYGIWVRQTGGQLTDASLAMRGGAAGTTDGNIITIDDASNSGFAYTNLAIAGQLTMWNSNGGDGNELNVLNGYATVGNLTTTLNPADIARFNILNGRLDVGFLTTASCTVTMLAGGTGEVNLADQSGALLDPMILNFETGSLASFTIAENGGASAVGYWETKIAAGTVQVDGVAKTSTNRFVIADAGLGTTITLNPDPDNYYDGSGALSDAANWELGLPSNTNLGLVTTTDGPQDFGSTAWVYSFQVRQTGGTITDTADAGISLRGGADNTTDNCTFEIDDASNTGFGTKNLDISGQLTLWNQYQPNGSTGNIFSVLNGYADVAILAGTNPANSTINILNGKLDVGYLSNARLTVNMLATGTGQFNLADMSGTAEAKSKLDQMILNFEPGSLASFTIASNAGGSAVGEWQTKVAAGGVKIDGVVNTDLFDYSITSTGGNDSTIQLSSVSPFPAPAQGPSTSANLIPNGEFDQVVDLVDDGATHANGWYNITNSFGTFDNFDGDYATATNWVYSAVDPSGLADDPNAVLTDEFYMDALVNINANNATGQLTFNSCEDFRHIMTQANALSAAIIDAGATYRFSVDAQGPSASYDNASGDFTVELKDGGGQIVELADTVNNWTGVKTVDISGALLDDGQVDVAFDMIATNAIPGYPTSAPHNDPSLVAKINVYEISLVEVYNYSVYDVNQDGVVDQADVDLASSYLDGSVDGGSGAVARQTDKMAEGWSAAEALAALNLTAFDVNGDGVFDAADETAIEEALVPSVIESALMNGSGDFVVQVSGLTIGTEYFLMKDTDLSEGAVFNIVAASVTATSTTETLTDVDAETESDQAFYQVTD